jgi:hypothetical protein
MDVVTLLADAGLAGLTVAADGDRLIVRGPKSGERYALEVLAHKVDILSLLGAETTPPPTLADYPRLVCSDCNADGYRMGDALTPPPGRKRWECPRCMVGWAVPNAQASTVVATEPIALPDPNHCPRCLTEGTRSTGYEGRNDSHADAMRVFHCVDTTFGDRRHTWIVYRSGLVES